MKRQLLGVFLALCLAVAFALSAAAQEYDVTEETPTESVSEASVGDPESEGALLAGDVIASGECGANDDNVTWTLDSKGMLIISGTGAIRNSPWWTTYTDLGNKIKTVHIESGVTTIGGWAFKSCINLESIDIPDSVASIADYAFSGCSSLKSITIPSDVVSIEDYLFDRCSALTSVNFPSGITSIGDFAFNDCKNLTNVILPSNLKSIGFQSFAGCNSLTNVTIPIGVREIDFGAFASCHSLTNIQVERGNSRYCSEDGILFNSSKTTLVAFPAGKYGDYRIPNYVNKIDSWAFSGCAHLTNVDIPENVSMGIYVFFQCTGLTNVSIPPNTRVIESDTFAGCSGLTSVIIPTATTTIESGAFNGCNNLKSVTILGNVKTIGEGAFGYCTSLTSIVIPKSVEIIVKRAFSGCSALLRMDVEDGNESYCSVDGVLFNRDRTTLVKFPEGKYGSYSIPNSVSTIAEYAFEQCGGLTAVAMPESVMSVEAHAFSECVSLKDVYYAGTQKEWNVISIGHYNDALKFAKIHYNSSDDIPADDYIFIAAGSASNLVDSDDGLYREYSAVERGAITTLRLREGITLPPVKNGVGSLKVADGYDNPALSTIVSASFDSDDIIVSGLACPEAYYARGIRRVNSEEVRVNTSQPDNSTLLDVSENVRVYFVDGDEIEEIYYDEIVNDTQDCVFYILADKEVTHLFICDDDGDAEPDVLIKDGEFLYVSGVRNVEKPEDLINPYLDLSSSNAVAVKKLYSYSYDERYFFEDADIYQHNLAKMSIRMAMAAYGMKGTVYHNGASRVDGNTTVSYLADEDSESTSEGIVLLMKNLQFTDIQVCYPKPGMDTIGHAIGSKRIANGDGTYTTLIAVAVRGGGYYQEWASNFTVGTASEHAGFARSANTVSQAVRSYITKIGATANLKIWVTGYSRGAAVANMTAQRLTYQANNGTIKGLTAKNIFAYCFECPCMVTTDSPSYQAIIYDNIFNIVNEIDLVTKVAPEAWNFSRYGITYYIPSAERTSNFYASYQALRENFRNILHYNSERDDETLDKMTAHYTAYFSGQGRTLSNTIRTLSHALDSQSVYSNGYEDLVQRAVLKKYEKQPLLSLGQIFSLAYGTISRHWPVAVKESVKIAEIVSEQIAKQITYAHYPELCLAWMDAITGESDYCINARTRALLVNCPVNVSVYDSSGALVAQIINDNPVEIDRSMIAAYIDESGQKVVLLPADEEYQIEVTATDNGTMSYQIEEMDADSGATARLVSYYDVPVSTGESFTGTAENLREDSEARYQLMGADNQAITPTVDASENIDEYLISVSVEGHGAVSGAGSYVVGEYVRLTARADSGEAFLGWYQDDALISTDLEYRFRVEDNQSLAAKFSDLHYKIQDISASDNVMTVSVTGRAVLSGTLLAALYTQDGQLVSVSTANITQAGEIPVRLTERKNAEIVTIFIFSNDNERKPLCQCLTQSLDFLP